MMKKTPMPWKRLPRGPIKQIPRSCEAKLCTMNTRPMGRTERVKLFIEPVVTAASELARNAVVHGGGGMMCLQVVRQENRQGLRVTFRDNGPGIPQIELAMKDGYTTAGGMGMGLPGAKRLVNEFDLSSTPSEGTVVTIVRWKA